MRKLISIILGMLLVLTAIWGGSYGMTAYPLPHWANFPIFFTSLVVFMGGCLTVIWSASGGEF